MDLHCWSSRTARHHSKPTIPLLISRVRGVRSRYSPTARLEGLLSKVSTNGWCIARLMPKMSGRRRNRGTFRQCCTLAPGESKTYGLRFLLSDSIRNIEKTLAENGRPVAVGVPGYVVPQNIDARLFLKYPKSVESMKVEPAESLAINGRRSARRRLEGLYGQREGLGSLASHHHLRRHFRADNSILRDQA